MTLGCLLADAWLSEQGRERLAEIKHWPRVLSPHRSGGWGGRTFWIILKGGLSSFTTAVTGNGSKFCPWLTEENYCVGLSSPTVP